LGFMAALMWYYSYKFKGIALFGNIVVAFVISFSILLPMFYNLDTFTIKPLVQIITYYTLFSFIIVLAREIIKCLEDMLGDNEYGIRTLPIVAGINTSKIIVGILFLFIIVGLGYFQYIQMQSEDFFKRNYFSSLYLLMFIQLPLIYVCFKMIKAQTPKQYYRLSSISKFVMLSGIMSLVVFYYLMN
jgi:4-hydroxybenzoate polyprenyltransferase